MRKKINLRTDVLNSHVNSRVFTKTLLILKRGENADRCSLHPRSAASWRRFSRSVHIDRLSYWILELDWGKLSAAVCERFCSLNSPHHLEIDLYETDQSIISPLAEVMENCRKEMKKAGHILNYKIHRKDFILSTIEHGKGLPLFDSNEQGPTNTMPLS